MAICLPRGDALWLTGCQERAALPAVFRGAQLARQGTSARLAHSHRLPSVQAWKSAAQRCACRASKKDAKESGGVEGDVEVFRMLIWMSSRHISLSSPLTREVALQVQMYPSPFFEAFLRSFVLGVGFGALFEVLHVGSQVGSLAPALKLLVCVSILIYGKVSAKHHLSF